ncbi:hypothetical protein [Propionivibrio sp.]|uniref:hypothetical protein n=1 Tax=Propionivibrio sp. TaxID=2212460 RepID=UPI003BF1EFF6
MAQIYWSYRPRKHIDGQASIEIDDAELDITGKQLLEGTKYHLSDLLPHVWIWFGFPPGDFDELNLLNKKTFDKMYSGQTIATFENPTNAQVMLTLGDFLAWSYFLESLALDALCANRLSDFVSRHTLSVSLFSAYETQLSFLQEDADAPCIRQEILRNAITANCTMASQIAAKPHREIKEKALELYRNGNFKSKNQAAEKIANQVHRSVAVVRGWLQGI